MNTRELKLTQPTLYREIYKTGHRTGKIAGINETTNRLSDILKIYKDDPAAGIQCFMDGLTAVDAAVKRQEVKATADNPESV